MLFRNPEGGEAAWAAEYVLPFGAQAASNVCQAWAHAIMKLVRDLFDEMEAANPDEDPFVTQWVVDRKELGVRTGNVEHRLAVAECYTDDSFAAIIGVARTIRYMRAWHEVTSRMNIMMAPPSKRQLGCQVTWLGAIMLTGAGLVTVNAQKRLHADAELAAFAACAQKSSANQKMNGLLEHLVDVFGLQRQAMFGMYRAGVAARDHPDQILQPDEFARVQAAKLRKIISSSPGSHFGSSFLSSAIDSLSTSSLLCSLFSDAALKGCDHPGLGGYYAGYFWSWRLPEWASVLTIPVLEFLAVLFNLIIFSPVIPPSADAVCLHVDAEATPLAMALHNPHSPAMQQV